MNYAKHIAVFEGYNTGKTVDIASLNAALRAAIELMNAAKPKDEAAERAHIHRCTYEIKHTTVKSIQKTAEVIERERAQARAEGSCEGYAFGRREQTKIAQREIDALEAKLSAAQAEIERRQSVQLHDAMLHGQTLLALHAAQAEIERLNRDWLDDGLQRAGAENVLKTKLENLRTAAERMLSWYDHGQARDREFRAAIEASR